MNKEEENKLILQDEQDKKWFDYCVKKHNIKLETFNFLENDFDKKFNDYKERLKNHFYNDENAQINEKGNKYWFGNSYADELIDYYSMLQHQFPQFLKDFLSEFVKTKFFKKYYEDYKEFCPNYADYCLANWQTSGNRHQSNFNDITNIFEDWVNFGEIPRYQGDEFCAIHIDFQAKKAEVIRGYAVGLYASRVLKNYRPVPKYMQPLVDKLFLDYENWKKENNYKN